MTRATSGSVSEVIHQPNQLRSWQRLSETDTLKLPGGPCRQELCWGFFSVTFFFSDRLGSPAWFVRICVHLHQNYTVSSLWVFIHDHDLDKVKMRSIQARDAWLVSLSYLENKHFMFFLLSHYQPDSSWRIFRLKSECAYQLGKIWHLLDSVPWK